MQNTIKDSFLRRLVNFSKISCKIRLETDFRAIYIEFNENFI